MNTLTKSKSLQDNGVASIQAWRKTLKLELPIFLNLIFFFNYFTIFFLRKKKVIKKLWTLFSLPFVSLPFYSISLSNFSYFSSLPTPQVFPPIPCSWATLVGRK
jgi:hypothetical protein